MTSAYRCGPHLVTWDLNLSPKHVSPTFPIVFIALPSAFLSLEAVEGAVGGSAVQGYRKVP